MKVAHFTIRVLHIVFYIYTLLSKISKFRHKKSHFPIASKYDYMEKSYMHFKKRQENFQIFPYQEGKFVEKTHTFPIMNARKMRLTARETTSPKMQIFRHIKKDEALLPRLFLIHKVGNVPFCRKHGTLSKVIGRRGDGALCRRRHKLRRQDRKAQTSSPQRPLK